MEKRTPHYSLTTVKALIREGSYHVSRTAMSGARQHFGLKKKRDIAECVLALEIRQFYKSMTVIGNSSLWQDVYHASVMDQAAYVKLQIADAEAVVISFKNLEDN